MDFAGVARRILEENMGLKSSETFLVLYDQTTLRIGESLFEAAGMIGAKALAMRMPLLSKNGEEPASFSSPGRWPAAGRRRHRSFL
jgi:hypothetical protein